MKRSRWTRILFASVLLAFLAGCAASGTSTGMRADGRPDSTFPME